MQFASYAKRKTLGDNMVTVFGLVLVAGLTGFAGVCDAADATWTAVSTVETGSAQNCGTGQGDWRVEITGNTIKYGSLSTNRSWTVDLKGLKPDGSGRVTGKDDKNREFYLTFDPGPGARTFRVTSSIGSCGYLFTPKR